MGVAIAIIVVISKQMDVFCALSYSNFWFYPSHVVRMKVPIFLCAFHFLSPLQIPFKQIQSTVAYFSNVRIGTESDLLINFERTAVHLQRGQAIVIFVASLRTRRLVWVPLVLASVIVFLLVGVPTWHVVTWLFGLLLIEHVGLGWALFLWNSVLLVVLVEKL